MLFPRTTRAKRVVQEIKIPVEPNEATTLASLLVWAVKQDQSMMIQVAGKTLPVGDNIIMWACHMQRNASAVRELAKQANISLERAQVLLQELRKAGRAVAAQQQKTALVQKLDELYPN